MDARVQAKSVSSIALLFIFQTLARGRYQLLWIYDKVYASRPWRYQSCHSGSAMAISIWTAKKSNGLRRRPEVANLQIDGVRTDAWSMQARRILARTKKSAGGQESHTCGVWCDGWWIQVLPWVLDEHVLHTWLRISLDASYEKGHAGCTHFGFLPAWASRSSVFSWTLASFLATEAPIYLLVS